MMERMNGSNIKETYEKLTGSGSVDLGKLFIISAAAVVKTTMFYKERDLDIKTAMKSISTVLVDIYMDTGIQEKAGLSFMELAELVADICTKSVAFASLPTVVRDAMLREFAEKKVSADIDDMLKEIIERTEN